MNGMRIGTLAVLALCGALVGCGSAGDATDSAPARTPESLVTDARQLDLDGEQDAAIALYRQALEARPDYYEAHYGLARALDLAGSYADARQHFARAVELAPDNGKDQPTRMMGIAWTFVGDTAQAAPYFKQVYDRRLAGGDLNGASDVANELGRVYLEHGEFDQAEAWYRAGHQTSSQVPGRLAWQVDLADMRWAHAQARIAARRGQADAARRLAARVRQLLDQYGNDDQEIQYPYLMGYVEFHLGNYQAAVGHLAQADQDDPFILWLLADASGKLGDDDAAAAYYRQVMASNSHAVNAAFARPVARQKVGAGR
jgi:tetratricopeptide (TPR) repeat protein